MDAERALISKLTQTGRGLQELERIIRPEHFAHEDCLAIWQFVRAHFACYGQMPSVPTIIERFPDFNFELSVEPLPYLRDRFMEAIERREAAEFVKELAVACNDPEQAGKLGGLILQKGRALGELVPLLDVEEPTAPEGWEARYILDTEPASPPEILGLFYPGLRHIVSGEPGAMKSWLALLACAEVIRGGGVALWLDFDEGGRADVYNRLCALGLSDREILRFVYLEPTQPIWAPGMEEQVRELIAAWQPRIVVIDATLGCLTLHGLDENVGKDVQRFYSEVVRPLRARGAAVLMIDHLPKAAESRGQYAIGSQRKVAGAEVHLSLEIAREFGKGQVGLATIHRKKDRPGHLPGPKCGQLRLESDAESGAVTYKLRLTRPGEEQTFRPTNLMEKVSKYLERNLEGASGNKIEKEVGGKRDYVRLALELLVAESFVRRENGPRGAHEHYSIRPYRETEDTDEPEPEGEKWRRFLNPPEPEGEEVEGGE